MIHFNWILIQKLQCAECAIFHGTSVWYERQCDGSPIRILKCQCFRNGAILLLFRILVGHRDNCAQHRKQYECRFYANIPRNTHIHIVIAKLSLRRPDRKSQSNKNGNRVALSLRCFNDTHARARAHIFHNKNNKIKIKLNVSSPLCCPRAHTQCSQNDKFHCRCRYVLLSGRLGNSIWHSHLSFFSRTASRRAEKQTRKRTKKETTTKNVMKN